MINLQTRLEDVDLKRTTRLFPSVICIVILIMAFFPSAVSAIAAEANEYEQLAPMQYQSISDMLDESEQHIADWISTPRKSYSFDDYVVCIEEIATDGYQGYASVSIEILRDDAIVLPLSCADETDFYYIPLSVHNMPVYFFDLSFSTGNAPEYSDSTAWSLSEDMRTLVFVEAYQNHGSIDIPSSTELILSFQLSVAYYANGTFSTVEHEISLDHALSCPIETYEFVPSKDVADAAATLGLEPPEFQAILTPFQLYTPGLTVRQDANEKVVIAPTYAADGTPYAWLLSTADGKLICDGRTYQQFPSDVSLCLYHLSPTYELVHVWKLQNADGRLVSTASSLGLSDGQYTAQ